MHCDVAPVAVQHLVAGLAPSFEADLADRLVVPLSNQFQDLDENAVRSERVASKLHCFAPCSLQDCALCKHDDARIICPQRADDGLHVE